MNKVYRIETVYTLKQPLSHIGTSESTETFLSTVKILKDGCPKEVFAYSGNAIRGALRDCGAAYLLDRLGNIQVPKKTFHLLFTGGSIGGEQKIDVDEAKRLRDTFPFISLFGGGVGSQILSGKITQTFAYPICEETDALIPGHIDGVDYAAQETSWKRMTDEASFSRKDDAKDILGAKYIAKDIKLLDSGEEEKEKGGPATQMRYTVEYLIPGVQLWHAMNVNCNEIELGALVSAIHEWAKTPYLGGMAGKGFGEVDAVFYLVDENLDRTPFITLKDSCLMLSDPAKSAEEQYNHQIQDLYNQYLDGNQGELIKMLGA